MRNNIQSLLSLFFASCMLLMGATSLEAACKYGKELMGDEYTMGVRLEWTTVEEEGNSMFVVERSSDGAEYDAVGTVVGIGDSDETVDYSFLDIMASGERIYYRLKQVDLDGASSYSRIYEMEKKMANNMMVVSMSNLNANESIDVTLDAMKEGNITCYVKNRKGEIVLEQKAVLTNGLNDIRVDLSSLKPDTYKVVFSMGAENEELVITRTEDEIRRKSSFASKNK